MNIIYYMTNDESLNEIVEKTANYSNLLCYRYFNLEQFFKGYYAHKPDIILLDFLLSNQSGLEILKEIRSRDQDTPIIMLSNTKSDYDKLIALDLGADDYLAKPFSVPELELRVLARMKKNEYENTYMYGNVILDDKKGICSINNSEVYLTKKEYEILKLLLKNQNNIVTKEKIFKVVWETDFIGKTRTLDMHIKSLRNKLKNSNSNIQIHTVHAIGYQLLRNVL